MRSIYKLSVICSIALLGVTPVFADEPPPDTCANECASGQIRASFLDGQQVNCVCMDAGPGMTDDSAQLFGGEGEQDPEHES